MNNVSSIEIDRPIADVFQLTTQHVAEWSIVVVHDEVLEGKGDVGTRFRTVTEEKGKRMEFQGIVTRHEPPRLHEVHLSGDLFDIDACYTFEDLGERTRVTQESSVKGKGFFRVFMAVFGGLMRKSNCRSQENELNSLKRFCEEYAVVEAE